MNILISNDDGIQAPGLLCLVKEMSKIGKVTVVAPDSQRSAYSHSMTIKGFLRYEKRDIYPGVDAYAVWGTPVDCVHAGIKKLCKEKPDIVISGINHGPNMGTDLIYSGTVGAAREGFILQIPAIAVSLTDYSSTDYSYAAEMARELAVRFVDDPVNKYCFLNLNVPSGEPKGIRVCGTIGWRDYDEGYDSVLKEDGYTYLVVSEDATITEMFDISDQDIDVNAVNDGYAALTPLFLDQIAHHCTEEIRIKYDKQ